MRNPRTQNTDPWLLCGQIEDYWRERGFHGVRAWVETISSEHGTLHLIRSNMLNGWPPREASERDRPVGNARHSQSTESVNSV
jgi:hypothetical protein